MANAQPTISTHVLDLASGLPAADVGVTLFRLDPAGRPELVADLRTDDDGRIRDLLDGDALTPGDYQLAFDVGGHLDDDDEAFFQSAAVALRIKDVGRSYHVPLLLSPYGLSTYRGS